MTGVWAFVEIAALLAFIALAGWVTRLVLRRIRPPVDAEDSESEPWPY